MEIVFNTQSFSTKLTDAELKALNDRVEFLKPDFNGTKTDAFKMILNDYFDRIKQIEKMLLEMESYEIENHKLIQDLQDTEKELQERKKFIEEMEAPADSLGFSDDQIEKLAIMAYYATSSGFINQNSVPALIDQIVRHYQSQGFFILTPAEIEAAKKELNF